VSSTEVLLVYRRSVKLTRTTNKWFSLSELRQPGTRRRFEFRSNTVGAGARLGINDATLICRMKKFGIYAESTFDLQSGS
jgi:hypothetical protein